MYIPGMPRNINPLRISYARREVSHKDVWEDLLKRIEHPDRNTLAFAEAMVLPSFVKAARNWPPGYRLLMKSDLKIDITTGPSDTFTGSGKKIGGLTEWHYPDKAVICINAYGRYSEDYFNHVAYHEIMHAISHLAVKDTKNKINILSTKHYPALHKLHKRYIADQNKANKEFDEQKKILEKKYNNSENTEEIYVDLYKAYIKAMDRHNCWAARKLLFVNSSSAKSYFMHGLTQMGSNGVTDEDEILAEGLMLYFGSDKQRNHLKTKEPELYKLIESEIVPFIK
ncbi:MAG: hypothetical protein ABIH00_00360 [Armatimonadota bacterium]